MTTKITEKNISQLANAGVNWQSVVTADGSTGLTAVAGRGYFIDTTSGAQTVTLPASPSAGDTIAIKDYAGTFATNKLTIARNGKNIQGVANNSEISTVRASVVLVFIDDTKGWLFTNESNVADLVEPLFITATGGTITTSGDYKIHTFTGDADFVVSQLGNSPTVPTGGPSVADYLVVAGGGAGGRGAGGGGGGGAGGFREGKQACGSPHTASPLAAATGIPVSVTTYPITVGAGGAVTTTTASRNPGSNSVFSTITSAGGGGAGGYSASPIDAKGLNGGSGGAGGAGPGGTTGGTGNTPPVSPSQGNPGGNGSERPGGSYYAGGGGGGASAPGGNGTSDTIAGPGGNGVSTSISGSSTAFGGGGGGSNETPGSSGTGGSGGGGAGVQGNNTSNPGTINTGGGGGGSGGNGGAGGSGIVVIRYKFQ